jgi:hypothetical protein
MNTTYTIAAAYLRTGDTILADDPRGDLRVNFVSRDQSSGQLRIAEDRYTWRAFDPLTLVNVSRDH